MSQKLFPPPYYILAERLVSERRAAGRTQEGLADRLLIGQSAVSKVARGVQRLDRVELKRWLSAIGSPSLTSFVSAFEERVREQKAAEKHWSRVRRRAGHPPTSATARKRQT